MGKLKSIRKHKAGKIKIAACYIVKNESEQLELSLKSLAKFVDEIILVDTGSTDESVKVAKKFGAKIFFEEWHDDFSSPRNLALEKVSSDWIVFLDADEYFTNLTAKNIRFAIEHAEESKIHGLLINRVNIDADNDDRILDASYIMRIFRKQPDLHYIGKIHEELRIGEEHMKKFVKVPPNILTLYHTGYSKSVGKAKAERNLKLLLEELETTDAPGRIYGYLAECYNGLEDFENAEKFAVLDIESGRKKTTYASRSYRILLSLLAKNADRFSERKKYVERAAKDFPELPEFLAELAECYAKEENFSAAAETMKTALEKFNGYDELEPTMFTIKMAEMAKARLKEWQQKLNE